MDNLTTELKHSKKGEEHQAEKEDIESAEFCKNTYLC